MNLKVKYRNSKKISRTIIFISLLAGLLFSSNAPLHAQYKPASFPKDTNLSLPELSFEVFWHTFEDHYAFFKLRGVDWISTYKNFRPKVNPETTDEELFQIFTAMVTPFNDDHINIGTPEGKHFNVKKYSRFLEEFPTVEARNRFWQMVDHTLIEAGFTEMKTAGPLFNGEKLFQYSTSMEYGYLRFTRSFGTLDYSLEDMDIVGAALDTIMKSFRDLKGLIVDVRLNIGGYDNIAYEIAGRFTDQKRLGHVKQSREGGYEEFGAQDKWYIEPKGEIKFLNPIMVLTNDQTASTGDVFALIMKELPHTTNIGENTTGIYSDMYEFELPNSWVVSLSNKRFLAADYICYEGIGSPVDILVQNTKEDLISMADPVVLRAIHELEKKK